MPMSGKCRIEGAAKLALCFIRSSQFMIGIFFFPVIAMLLKDVVIYT